MTDDDAANMADYLFCYSTTFISGIGSTDNKPLKSLHVYALVYQLT